MTAQEFDEKIKNFDPPWVRMGTHVYCPLYMLPKMVM